LRRFSRGAPPIPLGTINNYVTVSKARVRADKNTTPERMEALLEQVAPVLARSRTYRARANLNGIVVELHTNVFHQYDFWIDNWWAAPAGTLPHARLVSVNGVPDMEPGAYYCGALATSLFVNTEYYGQCKSWALGMAAAILERRFSIHSIHGALASLEGKGAVIVAPTGTGKTTQAFKLFLHPEGRIVGDDWVYVDFPEDAGASAAAPLIGVQPERSLYMRTETEKDQAWLRAVFDGCKLENITTRKTDCEFTADETGCQLTGGTCVFNKAQDHCYYAFGNSRALVPRERLLGPEKVEDAAEIRLIVLLRRDRENPPEVRLGGDAAIEVLREGRYQILPGAGPKQLWGTYASEPFYNPYLLDLDVTRQTHFWRLMFDRWQVPCLLLNTGVERVDQTHTRILRALRAV
jgi:hypothetical protein